ncbi:MAG TPA: hypothetical protein VIF64_14640 [Pyrinomonadaceae bacterium]
MDSSSIYIRRSGLLILALLLPVGCVAVEEGTLIDRGEWVVRREFLPHNRDSNKKVEIFWTKPAGSGPYPALLFIHGHQEQNKNGGEVYVSTGRLGITASRGYVAAAVSQPGYGNSDGERKGVRNLLLFQLFPIGLREGSSGSNRSVRREKLWLQLKKGTERKWAGVFFLIQLQG